MEKVESFIDNMMVGTENKKGHNELVKEILRRIKENNLYIKLKESKQKVREIDFLGVVIGLEGIKMEKENIKVMLDWPVPKSVKEIQKFLELATTIRGL